MTGPAGPPATVVFSERLGALGPIEARIAERTGAELQVAPLWTRAQLVEHGRAADVLVVGATEPVDGSVLRELSRTRCVVRRGVGVDNVDVRAATELGIAVAYVPDASVEEVSDHALALLLTVERGLPEIRAAVVRCDRAGASAAAAPSRRFAELTLGVVGYGRIGRALARKARSVVGRIVVTDPVVSTVDAERDGVRLLPLAELLATADLVSLHVPARPDGRALLDADRLRGMKLGAVLVNTARGELVDEDALAEAVRAGRLRGAALDVTRVEPVPADSPLIGLPGVLLTGHTAATGVRSSAALRQAVAEATVRVLTGGVPDHLSDPTVLDRPGSRLPARPPEEGLPR